MIPARRTFSYAQALETFPAVHRLTEAAVRQAEALFNPVQSREELEHRRDELEATYQAIIQRWTRAISRLGCDTKSLWSVDWDSGDGYYCWRYPEAALAHHHDYDEDFDERVPIN